ncbi:hypothetical protein SAMN05421670_1783 [Psychrobacillus psychrotolerans]|uniref:Uncharacterized protein n=1 Tax=Psychrobacillus psychrotolerans TaxID=126156 RepID=A0A1I5XXT1_9BACI|nr:hypothetical protein [Psychrobacillus psychrotolerans]SFQ36729.1 hypothetical protein SAMN05421670_1783 [Psychrobacillus psychrotolerans]
MKFRLFLVFIIGYALSFILLTDLYDDRVLNTLFRVCFALFFLFVIWLVQPKRKNSDDKVKRD